MKRKRRSLLIILLLLLIGVGYAAITTTLNINGNTTISKSSWDVHFSNILKSNGSEVAIEEAKLDSTNTVIEYLVNLSNPGDFYEFTVDIVNSGSIDAMVNEIIKSGLTSDQEKYIEYSATYDDGIVIEEKDILKANNSEKIKVTVKYRDDISSDDLPNAEQTLSLKFSLNYIQADESAKPRKKYICKRGKTLHIATCSAAGCSEYSNNNVISFGNINVKGNLASGDVFDCDVNGDGFYDENYERFYYVSDLYDTATKQFDSNYAVLIFYTNLDQGFPSNSFNTYSDFNAPSSEMLNSLPKSTIWSNVSLSNSIRNIYDRSGNLLTSNFSYNGCSSRFLTIQEIVNGCNVTSEGVYGELNNCLYLFENTNFTGDVGNYGYWLEDGNYNLDSFDLSIESTAAPESGVRPVIEVLKTDIFY